MRLRSFSYMAYCRYGDMMTVYLGSRETVYLNTEEIIREAFVKHGLSFAGRPQDIFWMKELCDGIGDYFALNSFTNFHYFLLFVDFIFRK